jgi:hypothetical protein
VIKMSSVTPRERREVAKSLRYLADLPGGPLENDEQFIEVLKYWIFADFKRYSYDETLTRLADLIDPTCYQVIEDETQVCSICSGDLDEGYGWDFCPHCGSRVVRYEA